MKLLKKGVIVVGLVILLMVAFLGITAVKAVSGIDNDEAFMQSLQSSVDAMSETQSKNVDAFRKELDFIWKMIDKIWTP